MTTTSIADEIFRELDEPADCSIPKIAFWLQTNVGTLNLKLGSAITVENGVLSDDLSLAAESVFKSLFKIDYLKRQINKNLGAAAYSSISEVKEGNRTVKRTNKNDIAKSYLAAKESEEKNLNGLIAAYKQNSFGGGESSYVPNPVLVELGSSQETLDFTRKME